MEHPEARRWGRRAWWWLGAAVAVGVAGGVVFLLWPKPEPARPRSAAIEPTPSALASREVTSQAEAAPPVATAASLAAERAADGGTLPPRPAVVMQGDPVLQGPPPAPQQANKTPAVKTGPSGTQEPRSSSATKVDKKPVRERPAKIEKAEEAAKDEGSLAALLRRGQAQLNRGQFPAAARTFREAVEADPTSADAHYGLGRALYDGGQEHAAQRHLERALALRPGLVDIYILLGAIYQSKGQVDRAKKAYQTYLKKRPRGKYAKELQSVLQSM